MSIFVGAAASLCQNRQMDDLFLSCLSGGKLILESNQSGCHYCVFRPYCTLMGFIKIGANQHWWVCEGVGGWGILHLNKMISPPVFSSGRRVFIHKVPPFTHASVQARAHADRTNKSPNGKVEPVKQYSGEIIAGRQGSSFHLKTL